VVADLDRRRAVLDRQPRIVGVEDALHDHRQPEPAHPFQVVPGKARHERNRCRGIVRHARGPGDVRQADALRDPELHADVALPAAEPLQVGGQHQRLVAEGDGPLDHRAARPLIGQEVDLVPAGAAGGGDIGHVCGGR
jgi:hypothetical protein